MGASTSTATSKPAVTPRAKKPSRPEQASKPKEVGARELLRQALGLYVRGRYEEAAARLGPLVQQKRLADRADQIEALRTYGIALFLSGARPGSERAFRELLRLAPKERLDPDFVKSEVVRFFESVRRRFRRELDKVVRQSAPKRSAVVNLLPPWGQAQNGHEGKVWVLAIGFGVTAAVSIGTAAAWYGARNDDGTFNTSDARANGLKVTNLVAAGLFAGFYLYGVIDGLVYYFKNRRARLDGEHVSRQVKGLALAPNGFRVRF
ncbi:MAG: hypothetical protein CSA65_08810 [Proteobacteria bacterium]|nr:MAG: hypothetical protein CSA65_08810 [Pseudomonadota bacterium]